MTSSASLLTSLGISPSGIDCPDQLLLQASKVLFNHPLSTANLEVPDNAETLTLPVVYVDNLIQALNESNACYPESRRYFGIAAPGGRGPQWRVGWLPRCKGNVGA